MEKLKNKKLFLLDMDGTIYNDNNLFDGTMEFLDYIEKSGGEYIFITNNSSKSVEDYVAKLSKMGIKVSENSFFTSTMATAMYLKDNFKDKLIYCMGTRSFVKELSKLGIKTTTDKKDNPDAVVVAFDTELTSQKLNDTCQLLFTGLPFIATNPDRGCPVEFGLIPDCAAICEAIYFATKRRPIYIGKPKPDMINYAVQKSRFSKDEAVVIGDRLYTDIASGINAGVTSIMVLSGECNRDDIEKEKIYPDYVFQDVKEILEKISNN
ncbi:MAG: HAD-IIA family hydrolase [Clostridia bacterium]|nr:HAD-IIA family hydrolase [Clostridia bacterium]